MRYSRNTCIRLLCLGTTYLLLPYVEPIGACHTFNFKIQQPGSGLTNKHGLWEAALNEMLQWKGCCYVDLNPGQNYVDTSSRKAFLHINRTPLPPQTMLMP